MRRLDPVLYFVASLVFLCCRSGIAQNSPEPARPLTQVSQVAQLSERQAAQSLPVQLEGTVTFVQPATHDLFIVDQGVGLYVWFTENIGLHPGDRVAVSGVTAPSFRPIVMPKQVRFLAHGQLPPAQPAKFEDLIAARWDSRYVQVTGHVLAAAVDQKHSRNVAAAGSASGPYPGIAPEPAPEPGIDLQIQIPNGTIQGFLSSPSPLKLEDLVDTDIRISGVAAGAFDSKMQMAGIRVLANTAQEIQILSRPPEDTWSQPVVPLDQVVAAYRFKDESARVHIIGLLTYYEPGSLAVIENQGKTILLETQTMLPLHPGQAVEATGFPGVALGSVRLVNAQLRAYSQASPIQPPTITWEKASAGSYAYNLVAMEGEVVGVVHDSRMDLFIIRSGEHLFSASLRRDSSEAEVPQPEGSITPIVGSRIRVTGVCFLDDGNHWRDRVWFDLRMRSLADAVALSQPPWWNVRRLTYVSFVLSVAILLAIIWAGLLDRRLRQQNARMVRQRDEDAIRERTLARQEQHRSQILELISSSAPLTEVLSEVQSMVSARLFGAPCWFELNGDSDETKLSQQLGKESTITRLLKSPDGTPLGKLHATPWQNAARNADIPAALVAGARLAELAIDTRRLYSDLRRRSEYDTLTSVPNRFSMEKQLKQLMEDAALNKTRFGMIYVDLDRFKQVNDQYGHRIGDLYLQAVAQRMKLQLRDEDVLARIGGDEFIALVPALYQREVVEQIAMRLELCFEEPFQIDGHQFAGSASLGLAVYPEDGTTPEELQHAADAAMYAHKANKRHQEAAVRDAVNHDPAIQALQLAWREDVAD
jgi:diguanylate cyclase (GGDEF)-like protein